MPNNSAQTLALVKTLLAEVCGIEPRSIQEAGQLAGYGLDSVRTLDLLLGLEERLGIVVDEQDPDLAKIRTVRDLVEFVERKHARP